MSKEHRIARICADCGREWLAEPRSDFLCPFCHFNNRGGDGYACPEHEPPVQPLRGSFVSASDFLTTSLERIDNKEEIKAFLSKLSYRESAVLCARYGIGGGKLTLDECARRFDVTRERIRQIEAKALRRCAHAHEVKEIQDLYRSAP